MFCSQIVFLELLPQPEGLSEPCVACTTSPHSSGTFRTVRSCWTCSRSVWGSSSCLISASATLHRFPHSYCNINIISICKVNLSSPGALGPVDHWHNDSIAYAGVVVISDMEGMEGGELELFKGDKELGKKMLKAGEMKKELVETVSYENPGKMILTHGSEVCSET